ncbi:hypothetical protein [Acinetobacter dispersus]|uniref:hypothetical protein n=2 Tax=Acinetobacter dispersus TaxID=70348 RepID=UPI0021CDBB56|nr:hypothetical protein [Acinetobacter dispersus]MCU4337873.1 hypothetical protein [Acinetobacter dispersus]
MGTQMLIQFGFDVYYEMSLDEVVQALKFCPLKYEIKQLDTHNFFFTVEDAEQKKVILNFLSDYKLRQELSQKISLQQKSFVDAIIMASISK